MNKKYLWIAGAIVLSACEDNSTPTTTPITTSTYNYEVAMAYHKAALNIESTNLQSDNNLALIQRYKDHSDAFVNGRTLDLVSNSPISFEGPQIKKVTNFLTNLQSSGKEIKNTHCANFVVLFDTFMHQLSNYTYYTYEDLNSVYNGVKISYLTCVKTGGPDTAIDPKASIKSLSNTKGGIQIEAKAQVTTLSIDRSLYDPLGLTFISNQDLVVLLNESKPATPTDAVIPEAVQPAVNDTAVIAGEANASSIGLSAENQPKVAKGADVLENEKVSLNQSVLNVDDSFIFNDINLDSTQNTDKSLESENKVNLTTQSSVETINSSISNETVDLSKIDTKDNSAASVSNISTPIVDNNNLANKETVNNDDQLSLSNNSELNDIKLSDQIDNSKTSNDFVDNKNLDPQNLIINSSNCNEGVEGCPNTTTNTPQPAVESTDLASSLSLSSVPTDGQVNLENQTTSPTPITTDNTQAASISADSLAAVETPKVEVNNTNTNTNATTNTNANSTTSTTTNTQVKKSVVKKSSATVTLN